MPGADPNRFMQRAAGKLNDLQDRIEIEDLLNELEYLMAVLDPKLQDPTRGLSDRSRDRTDKTR